MLQRLVDDLRHGIRFLRTAPGLCLTAALLVALVVGGNATIYSMVNGVIRQPAPGVTAEDIVSFGLVGEPGAPYFTYGDYSHYAAQTSSLRSLAAWGFSRVGVSTPAGNYLQQVTPVTRNYFDTIGIVAAKGRLFAAEDDRQGAPLVAVINDGIWRSYFHAADDVIGQRITVNGRPTTIVGVTPPRFAGPSSGEWSDLWVPLHAYNRVDAGWGIAMIGRLAPGSSIARVRAEFATLQARLDATSPAAEKRAPVLVTRYAASAGGVIPAFETAILAIFSIVTLLTLLVVCANVANLMLARAVVRQRETAVRQSLGASRSRILRLIVVEGLAIAAVACVLAFVVASWASSLVPALLPQGRATFPLDFSPDWRVVVYAAGLTLIGTVLFSLVPALRAWRQDPLPLLKEGSYTTAFGRSKVSKTLVVLQLAFSVLLLTCAALAYRSGILMQVDVGFDSKNILLASIGTPPGQSAENLLLLDRVRERFAALPNVASVGYVNGLAVSWNRAEASSLDATEPVPVTMSRIGPGYLETLGVKPLAGRTISAADRLRSGGVAVINQHLADTLFFGRSALGQTLLVGRERQPVEIVGVVPNVYYRGFNAERPDQRPHYVFLAAQPAAGEPREQNYFALTTYYLRYTGGAESVVAAVPAVLREIDPKVAFASSETLEAQLEEMGLTARLISTLLGSFAAVSLLIAAVGQYAVVAFNMRRRTRDFGVRIALGASGPQIVGSVLGEGLGLTAVGLAAGFVLSIAVATALRGVLFGVTPTDGPTYAGVFALLACVSLVASYLPARRASRIDPVQALRQD
jgi:predicted permease